MIPVLTASAPPLRPTEQAALDQLERVACAVPSAAQAAAELGAAMPLWSLLADQWTDAELIANDARVVRRVAPWISTGLVPRARRAGELPHHYAAALDAASLALSASPRARHVRSTGRLVRRFARVPAVRQLLQHPDVARNGAADAPTWRDLSRLVSTLATMEPRTVPTAHDAPTAGSVDWSAADARAREERRAMEARTRAAFYARTGKIAAAYASATAVFPALGVAAPYLAAGLAWGAAMFEAFLGVSRLVGGRTGFEPAEVERAARELRWWNNLGVPPLRYDEAIWTARGYADTLSKLRAWFDRAPADVQGALRDLGMRIRDTGATSAVANAAADVLAVGPTGYGPIWWGSVFKRDPGARLVANRMGAALGALYASDYERRGFSVPEARVTAAATEAYHRALLDPSIPLDDTYGTALARAVQSAVATAEAGKLALLRVTRLPSSEPTPTGGGAAVVGAGLAALLFFL